MDRLPLIEDDRVQVDCFPGARIAQATYLLKNNTPVSPQVRIVVVHFGLNDRSARDPNQVGVEMGELRGVCRETFPLAKIHIPMMNFSTALNLREWSNMSDLNQMIQQIPDHIPNMEPGSFKTTRDGVHWSVETGVAIWTAWRKHIWGQTGTREARQEPEGDDPGEGGGGEVGGGLEGCRKVKSIK